LRKKGVYFQKHYKKIIGAPDIALPRKKKAVFVDGDFWHGKNFAKLKRRLPKKYWLSKIEGNIKRDKKNRTKLRREGWSVLRVWESKIDRDPQKSINLIKSFLKNKVE
jgi:DNA mismatch endonuclease (patch repair protein)